MPNDQRLRTLLAAAGDDETALAEFVHATEPVVWRTCLELASPAEVEDCVQETYVRAVGAMPAYRGDASVAGWLATIARNVCADHVRRRVRRARGAARLEGRHDDPTVTDHDGAVTEDLLARLDPDRRAAFLLTQLVQLSYAEAAQVLGCPIGTVRSRVSRARNDLIVMVRHADAS